MVGKLVKNNGRSLTVLVMKVLSTGLSIEMLSIYASHYSVISKIYFKFTTTENYQHSVILRGINQVKAQQSSEKISE